MNSPMHLSSSLQSSLLAVMIYPIVSDDCVSSFQRAKWDGLQQLELLLEDLPRFFYPLHTAHVLGQYFLNENQNLRIII